MWCYKDCWRGKDNLLPTVRQTKPEKSTYLPLSAEVSISEYPPAHPEIRSLQGSLQRQACASFSEWQCKAPSSNDVGFLWHRIWQQPLPQRVLCGRPCSPSYWDSAQHPRQRPAGWRWARRGRDRGLKQAVPPAGVYLGQPDLEVIQPMHISKPMQWEVWGLQFVFKEDCFEDSEKYIFWRNQFGG